MQNLFFPIELLTALLIYIIRLEKREKIGFRAIASAAVIIILLTYVGSIWMQIQKTNSTWLTMQQSLIYLGTVVMCGVIVIIMTMIVWSICHVSIQEAMYCTACAYLTEHIAYCIRLIANHVTARPLAANGSIAHIAIHIAVYLISYQCVAKNMIQDKHYATSALQSLRLLLISAVLVILLSTLASVYDFELLHGIYALFACGAILYSQVIQQKQIKLQEELNIQNQIWLKYKAQYDMARDTVDIINLKCHDLKYQIQALHKINNHEEQKKAIELMEESVEIYDSVFHTENEYLNTVLTEKSLLCKKNHIVMTCIADGSALDFMDAVDLYTLFGNALDNAMEAVMKLDEDKRLINLLLQKKAGLVIAQIENYYQGEIRMEKQLPVTTKAEKAYHGFGIKSIVDIVEKYHGIVTIETEKGIFVLRITIPAKEM